MLSVVFFVMQSVVMLSIVILIVMAPYNFVFVQLIRFGAEIGL